MFDEITSISEMPPEVRVHDAIPAGPIDLRNQDGNDERRKRRDAAADLLQPAPNRMQKPGFLEKQDRFILNDRRSHLCLPGLRRPCDRIPRTDLPAAIYEERFRAGQNE